MLDAYAGRLLPDDVYEPWTERARATRSGSCGSTCCARPSGGTTCSTRSRPTSRPTSPWSGPAPTGATCARRCGSSSGWTRPSGRELGTTPSPEAERLRARLEQQVRPRRRPSSQPSDPAVRPTRRRRPDRASASTGPRPAGAAPCWSPGRPASASPPCSGWPRRSPAAAAGAPAAAPRRPSRGRGPTPPVLEALGDLCRQHPALLDGLDDLYRLEIERALSGRDVSWTGESGHQRLFVAAAELMRLAAAGHGLLLVVDDIQEADEASLRLLHYLSRCAVDRAGADRCSRTGRRRERPDAGDGRQPGRRGARAAGSSSRRSAASATRRLLADRFPDLDDGHGGAHLGGQRRPAVHRCWSWPAAGHGRCTAASCPLCRRRCCGPSSGWPCSGSTFSTDELLAVSGVDEDESYHQLEVALAGLVVERGDAGYRFRHALVRESLVDQLTPAHRGLRPPGRGRAAGPARCAARPGGAPLPRGGPAVARRALRRSGRWRRPARWVPTATG